MKAKLLLNLNDPEQRRELNRCLKAQDYLFALTDIADEIFRPARKHGYDDDRLNSFLYGRNDVDKDDLKAKEDTLNDFICSIEDPDRRILAIGLLSKLETVNYEKENDVSEAIGLLEEKFYEILRERKVDLDDAF